MNSSMADAFRELLSGDRNTVTDGLPRYTFDPATQQYALAGQYETRAPKPENLQDLLQIMGERFSSGIFSKNKETSGVPRFDYNPATQQYTRLASGGQVMNQGLAAAQHAQSMGRGNDTVLVHMTPGEVKGLQALAMSQGGSLTINPQTGLPEAGFLSAILPMVAGFALGPAGFGLMSSALGAGALVGGITALATGSLQKGLMAGLGAYSGSGLGEGLQAAAAGTQPNLASPAMVSEGYGAATAAPMTTPQAMDVQAMLEPGITTTTPTPAQVTDMKAFMEPGVVSGTPSMTPAQVQDVRAMMEPGITSTGEPLNLAKPTGLDVLTKGVPALTDTAGRSAFMAAAPTGTIPTTAMTLASAFTPKPPKVKKQQSYIRPYNLEVVNTSADFTPYTFEDSSERPMVSYKYSPQPIYKAAEGGVIDPDYDMQTGGVAAFSDTFAAGGPTGLDTLMKKRKSLKGDPLYKFAQDRRDSSMEASIDQNFASGGLKAALPPRFLSGGGDGMSDSIKANIDGKQEARLADGEFVVPADVVSHLGNGSSKAGAKKLYSMMDKIRKARTGKTRQAPEVNAAKYMPA